MMVDKFSVLSKKFQAMYEQGKPYDEIAKELGINVLTIQSWRVKLGLPPRRNRNPRSWMDVPVANGLSPREVLHSIAKSIGITEHDIEFILTRVDKLKSKVAVRGRTSTHLILSAAFMYLRWDGSGRRPMSAQKFIKICAEFGLSRSSLRKACRLFTEAQLYPKQPLKPEQLFERTWKSLQQDYDLPEIVRTRVFDIIKTPRLADGWTPAVVVAGCLYWVCCNETGSRIAQADLAEIFGVTEVSIRNMVRHLERKGFSYLQQGANNCQPLA